MTIDASNTKLTRNTVQRMIINAKREKNTPRTLANKGVTPKIIRTFGLEEKLLHSTPRKLLGINPKKKFSIKELAQFVSAGYTEMLLDNGFALDLIKAGFYEKCINTLTATNLKPVKMQKEKRKTNKKVTKKSNMFLLNTRTHALTELIALTHNYSPKDVHTLIIELIKQKYLRDVLEVISIKSLISGGYKKALLDSGYLEQIVLELIPDHQNIALRLLKEHPRKVTQTILKEFVKQGKISFLIENNFTKELCDNGFAIEVLTEYELNDGLYPSKLHTKLNSLFETYGEAIIKTATKPANFGKHAEILKKILIKQPELIERLVKAGHIHKIEAIGINIPVLLKVCNNTGPAEITKGLRRAKDVNWKKY